MRSGAASCLGGCGVSLLKDDCSILRLLTGSEVRAVSRSGCVGSYPGVSHWGLGAFLGTIPWTQAR